MKRKSKPLTPEREYHKRVLDCVADRIEDAMKRKATPKKDERRP